MKTIIIRRKDKIEVRDSQGRLLLDIIIAGSSKTSSINLSFKDHTDALKINRVANITVPFGKTQVLTGQRLKQSEARHHRQISD